METGGFATCTCKSGDRGSSESSDSKIVSGGVCCGLSGIPLTCIWSICHLQSLESATLTT